MPFIRHASAGWHPTLVQQGSWTPAFAGVTEEGDGVTRRPFPLLRKGGEGTMQHVL